MIFMKIFKKYIDYSKSERFVKAIDSLCDHYRLLSGLNIEVNQNQKDCICDLIINEEKYKSSQLDDTISFRDIIKDSYGLSFVEEYKGVFNLNDVEKSIKKINCPADIDYLKVTQPGIELFKLLNIILFNKEKFMELCKKHPLMVISTNGNYLIDGNHRLLYSKIVGIDSLPVNKYYIQNKYFRNFLIERLSNQNNVFSHKSGYFNVLGLEKIFKEKFEKILKLTK